MHISDEILVTLKFMGILASASKKAGFHSCFYQGVLVFFWVRKSYIQCLPWSFGRVELEQNLAQVRITKEKGTLSRPNINILVIKVRYALLPFTKSRVKKGHLNFWIFFHFGINFVNHLHTLIQTPRFPNIRKKRVWFVSSNLKHV